MPKRFKYYFSSQIIKDNKTGQRYYGNKPLAELLNKLYEDNEQLKQRNNRQAKRLGELYELIAKKDWESLTEIIDDFCSCEEQLQREWRHLNYLIQMGLDND